MDQKKTILTAVIVNAGLLVILFIGALTSEDEIVSSQIVQQVEPHKKETLPVAVQEKKLVQEPPLKASSIEPIIKLPEPVVTNETPITHKLPPPVISTPQAPVVKQTPVAVKEEKKENPHYPEVVVKKGDSLDKIAKAHHTTVDEIVKLNQLPGSFLKIGQVLKIPEGKKAVQTPKQVPVLDQAVTAGPDYYTIKVGDNPWGIAMKHHMKLDELLKLNNLNEEKARKLKPGDRLRIR